MKDQGMIKRVIYYVILALWPLIFIYIFGPMVVWAQSIFDTSNDLSGYMIVISLVGIMATLYCAITLFLFYRYRHNVYLFVPLILGFVFSCFYTLPLFLPMPTQSSLGSYQVPLAISFTCVFLLLLLIWGFQQRKKRKNKVD